MSPELKQFYKDLQQWIDNGFPNDSIFDPIAGLCGNLDNWLEDPFKPILEELKESFGGVLYPFNADTHDFITEDLYKNPKRLAWIRKQAMED